MDYETFDYLKEALSKGYWWKNLCILAQKGDARSHQSPVKNWISKEITKGSVLVWNDKTHMLSEKSIYGKWNAYKNDLYIKYDGKKVPLSLFNQRQLDDKQDEEVI